MFAQTPQLLLPKNNFIQYNDSLVISWNPINDASYYELNIADDSVFTINNVTYNIYNSAADTVLKNMQLCKKYYWRVKAFGSFISNYSNVWSFLLFNPRCIPGLQLWVSSDSGIVSDGSNNISEWIDRSGKINNAVQSTLANQPLFFSNSLNNLPSLKFTDDALVTPNINIGQRSEFILAKKNGAAANSYHTLLSQSGPNFLIYIFNIDSVFNSLVSGVGGGHNLTFNPNFQIISRVISSNQVSFYQNGIAGIPLVLSCSPSNSPINIGDYQSRPLNGDVSEVIIYDHPLIDSARSLVENYVHYKYAPPVNLGPNKIVCSLPVTLNVAKDYYSSYLWQDGSSSDSLVINAPGLYYITVKDIFGFFSKDSINVILDRPNPFQLNDTVSCGSPVVWNTGLSHDLFTFQWQDNSNDSVMNISQPGQYYVSVTNLRGCITVTDTINFSIDNFSSTASLGSDTSLCSGNSIYLKNGSSQATSYLWSDNSNNDSLQINSSGQYWVTVSNINSCSKTDTINISIAGNAPTALFSSNNICMGNAIQFNDLSTPPSGDIISLWNWNFGDNTTSILQDPSHMFADTGTYVVKLDVTTNAGCSSAYARIIHVYPNPVAGFTSSNLCQNASVQFTGNASTFGYPINQWNWNFSDPSSGNNDSSLLQNPKHIYSLNGTYPVRLIVSNINGCKDTVVNNVIIKQAPVTDFTSSLSCKTDLTQFTDNTILPSATSVQSSFWNFGDLGTSTLLNPKHTYSANVTYNVTHVITAINGCKDTAIKTITVYPKPFAYFSYGNTCVGSPVNFYDLSVISGATITSWQWSFGTSGTSVLQNPEQTFATSGNINTQLIVISDQGCKDTAIQSVTIHSNPVASFTFNPAYGTPPLTAFFNNTSTGATSYSWNFDDGSALSTLISPSHVFNDTGSFQISLAAINTFGCTDTIIHSINTALRLTDVGVSGFTTTFQNNFLTITAQIDNHGTVDIHTMELYAKVNDGPFIKEEWGGSLLKDGTMFYTFNSDVFVENEDHYICVSVQKPNGLNDDRPADNEFCQTLSIARFQTFSPYPNPTENIVTLPVFMPVLNDLSIVVYNDQGKKVEDVYSGSLEEGFHTIQFNTESLNAGLYIFRIKYKDETVIRKFIKK